MVWMQIILGAVNLLPTPTGARSLKQEDADGAKDEKAKPAKPGMLHLPSFSLGTALALAVIVAGIILPNLWFVMLGGFILLGAQLSSSANNISSADADAILVREVMLTEYTLLSSSDTLQGALGRTVHSLQDVFPIVRGDRLVGSIARQSMAERLLTDGDSYLQGIMTRSLQLASPGDKLVEALRRAAALGASEFIPVVENGAMIGILTPQSLARAVQQVKVTRPAPKARESPRDRGRCTACCRQAAGAGPLSGGDADRQSRGHHPARAAGAALGRPHRLRRHAADRQAAEPLWHHHADGELSRAQ
jgi:predicted transcriptional regulator